MESYAAIKYDSELCAQVQDELEAEQEIIESGLTKDLFTILRVSVETHGSHLNVIEF